MKREVDVFHAAGGFYLQITDRPRWVVAKEWAWYNLCTLTRGWIGGHGMPDKFWKIPVGRAKWDHHDPDEPWLINSVANMFCDLEQWVLNLGDDFRGKQVQDRMVTIPIPTDVAEKLDPDYVKNLPSDDEDDHE